MRDFERGRLGDSIEAEGDWNILSAPLAVRKSAKPRTVVCEVQRGDFVHRHSCS